jgi:hypothetical protein
MKNRIIKYTLLAVILVGVSCKDESLDPFRLNEIQKGSFLALRGDAFDELNDTGCPGGFFFNAIQPDDAFTFEAEFLSEDPTALANVEVFAKAGTTRVKLKEVSGSNFTVPSGGRFARGTISVTLTEVLTALNISDPSTLDQFDLLIENDLTLKDGTKIPSSSIVNSGLFESAIFFPAMSLNYCVNDIEDFRPIATTSQRGQFIKNGTTVTRPVWPLKEGAKDTLNIVFDQDIKDVPTISLEPNIGTLGTLTRVKDSKSSFFLPYTAPAGYTGNVDVTISGATADGEGALDGLEQEEKVASIAVDNLAPQSIQVTTGTRVGKGGSVAMTFRFNERMRVAPKVSFNVAATQIDDVTDQATTLSSDGLSATFTYDFKDSDNNALHGSVPVTVTGGSDVAGNLFGSAAGTLTIDIAAPPSPVAVLDGTQFDWGTQIKWTITQSTSGSNPGGAVTGTVYFVVLDDGEPAPTGFVTGDVPGFTLATDVTARQAGTVSITATTGTTGSIFTNFSPNGDLDVYFVFVGSTGNISPISAPLSVTMQ